MMTLDAQRSVASIARRRIRARAISRAFVLTTAATLLVLCIAHGSHAECTFAHPKKAAKFQASLVQAFVPCECYDDCQPLPGGGFICTQVCGNATDEYGHPACKPPETFREQSADVNGWQWDESRGRGDIKLRARSACTGVSTGTSTPPCSAGSPLNPPGTADLAVTLRLKGVVTLQGPASGTGSLALLLRITLDDPMAGGMTVLDFPASFPFDLANGAARTISSLDALLNNLDGGLPGLPACASVEILSAIVLDPDGNQFATMGIWLPDL